MLGMERLAVAPNVAVLAQRATVTEGGRESRGLLLVNVTFPAARNDAVLLA